MSMRPGAGRSSSVESTQVCCSRPSNACDRDQMSPGIHRSRFELGAGPGRRYGDLLA